MEKQPDPVHRILFEAQGGDPARWLAFTQDGAFWAWVEGQTPIPASYLKAPAPPPADDDEDEHPTVGGLTLVTLVFVVLGIVVVGALAAVLIPMLSK